jgi:hypothetical protein
VFHVHLGAAARVRRERYDARENLEGITFAEASQDATEQQVDSLRDHANIRLRTDWLSSPIVVWSVRCRFFLWGVGLTLRANRRLCALLLLAWLLALGIALLAVTSLAGIGWLPITLWLGGAALVLALIGVVIGGGFSSSRRLRRRLTSSLR